MANILETPLEYHPKSSGALGIAFLAGYATGRVSGLRAIKTDWLVEPVIVRLQPEAVEIYRQLYPVYCYLDQIFEPAFAMLQYDDT